MFFNEEFLLLKTHNKHTQNKQKSSLPMFCFVLFFGLHLPACRILSPLSKIESVPLTVKM